MLEIQMACQLKQVQVGTTSPSSKLHISDTNSPEIRLQDSDAGSTYNITAIQNAAGSLNLNTRDSSGSFVSTDYQISKNGSGATAHKWFIAGSEKVRIDSSGNVGIGTTSPDGRLHVANFQSTKQLTLERTGSNSAKFSFNTFTDSMTIVDEGGGSGAERMRIDSSGNLGIGTSSPDEKLQVEGDLKVNTNNDAGVIHFGNTSDQTKIIGYDSSDKIDFQLES
jgi:hypothetical protein